MSAFRLDVMIWSEKNSWKCESLSVRMMRMTVTDVTNKLSEVYVRPVRSPGACEGVDIHLVPPVQLQQHGLPHHVIPLVLPVLVNNAGHVNTILPQ